MADRASIGRAQRAGWLVFLAVSALLFAYGVMRYFTGPEMALENIAERTTLTPEAFRAGSPSAFDVITIIARQGAAFTAGLGLASLILGWQGFRTGSRQAWWAAWSLPAAVAGSAAGYVVPAGVAPQVLMFLGVALVAAIGLLVASRGTQP